MIFFYEEKQEFNKAKCVYTFQTFDYVTYANIFFFFYQSTLIGQIQKKKVSNYTLHTTKYDNVWIYIIEGHERFRAIIQSPRTTFLLLR